jgi:serine/threonine protein kinase
VIVIFTDGTREEYENTPGKQGAEGEVYLSLDKKSVVKLYQKPLEKRRQRLEKLLKEFNPARNDPYWQEFFAWPEQLVKEVIWPEGQRRRVHYGGFRMRYVTGMNAISHYIFQDAFLLLPPEERGWFIGRVACAIKIASAADRLAHMGLCYADFSENNILVDPFTGRATLIDCDSLTVPGVLESTVNGTDWYRPPEIITKKVTIPSLETDRHALAVLLYCWLVQGHPLVGPDRDIESYLGQQALYIEHPTNPANSHRGQRIKAEHLGHEIQQLFTTAFIDGLHDPERRPRPREWVKALCHMYDWIIPCASPTCDWRFFVVRPGTPLICPMCRYRLRKPSTLPIIHLFHPHQFSESYNDIGPGSLHYLVGWPERSLHQWHIRYDASPVYQGPTRAPDVTPYALIQYKREDSWYLHNLKLPALRYRLPSDAQDVWHTCPVDQVLPLVENTYIQFGGETGYYAYVDMVSVS